MKRLLKMELYEFKHDYICLFMIGIAFIYGMFSSSGYLSAISYYNLNQGGYGVFIAMLYDAPGTCILFSTFPALLIGKSFSNRTIVSKIAAGNSRRNVLFSKAISILIISTMCMIIYPISGALIITIKYGWNSPALGITIALIKIIICTSLLYVAIFSIIIFVGIIFRDTFRTVIASVITILFNAIYLFIARSLNLPEYRHPMNLLRIILEDNSTFQFISFSLEGIILLGVILMLSYKIFRRCELK